MKIKSVWKSVLFVLLPVLLAACAASSALFMANTRNLAQIPYPLGIEGRQNCPYTYHDYDFFTETLWPEKRFENTRIFGNVVRDATSDLIRYCVLREQMETDGSFDEKKVIDIKQYANHREMPLPNQTQAQGFAYYLKDLVRWAQYGWETEKIGFGKIMVISEDKQPSAVDAQTDAKKEAVAELSEEFFVSSVALGEEQSEIFVDGVVERFLPIDKVPLIYHTANLEEYNEYMGYLKTTLEMIGINYAQYRAYQEYFDVQNLSMAYYITVGEGEKERIYTNMKTRRQGWKAQEVFPGFGEYLHYESASSLFESSVQYVEAKDIKNIWQKYTYAFSEPFTVWIGIDTAYPYADNWNALSAGYAACMEENALLMKIALASGCAALLILLVMTVFAGRRKGVEGIVLLRFDRLPTECALLLYAAAVWAAVYSLQVFANMAQVSIGEANGMASDPLRRFALLAQIRMFTCMAAGGWAFVSGVALLFFHLSFVRRLKAHSIFPGSLIVRLCSRVKQGAAALYKNSGPAFKTIVPAFGLCLCNLFGGFLSCWVWRRVILGKLSSFINVVSLFILAGVFAVDLAAVIWLFMDVEKRQRIVTGIGRIRDGELSYKINTAGLSGDNRELALAVNSIGEGIQKAVESSMKDERMRTELITNVSHDIKTPLTSIINYVDLLKRENIQDDTIRGYIGVLDMKSQRLKQLTEDLVEASKISSGSITLEWEELNLVELLRQTAGEYAEKFHDRHIALVMNLADHPVKIMADSRRMWRIIENLYSNICKYAMEGTRAYVDAVFVGDGQEEQDKPDEPDNQDEQDKQGASGAGMNAGISGRAVVILRNISAQPLNIAADELTERFIRGDLSRSSEGSGLGLSIAKSLVEAQRGSFSIYLDGDLFKVTMEFPAL